MFIVTKTIDSENISKVCRTCLREDNDKMVCLFIGPAESSLGAKLQSLSCLEVAQGDGLPEKMCDRCVTRAESALLFREQCRAADQALRQAAVRVSKERVRQNVLPCKAYQQTPSFVPFQYSQEALKPSDCRALANHQELYLHNRLHPPFYREEDNIPQHMHIVESHNNYLNLSRYSGGSISHESLRPDDFDPITRHNTIQNRASCALQCSLCHCTFTNRTQLENHCITHNSDNVDISSDEVNIEVEENSNHLERNHSYERCISQSVQQPTESIAYNKMKRDCESSFQDLTFSNSINGKYSDQVSVISTRVISQEPESMARSKPQEIPEKNRFKCETCSRLFSQKSKLLAHQATHDRKKPFKCMDCGKSYSSRSKLTAHSRLHTQTNVHRCKICQKIFSYPSYLADHMKSHDAKPVKRTASFECAQCKKQFQFAKSYKRHMKFHTGKDLFHCDICDKLFNQKYALKTHMRSHEFARFHKCDLCDKSFNQKSNLVEHMRIHTKVKPFKCKTCEKSFAQSSHLKSHEASHDSVRQFQCRMCGKRFKLASHLKRHVNLHTGLKMYKCDQCEQVFSQAFSLKRHSKKHSE
ncbi:zinc finger protein 808 [Nasonia vitripennis]|uniref:Zinc finger protein 865 n=1 Tax=Nasonia vitripennis TaxID=7425 RepID=A0A7M7ITN6_NASVI|nr:zinc finger protein 808 [Nasonia vitripennis]